jgi:hypothetical protein
LKRTNLKQHKHPLELLEELLFPYKNPEELKTAVPQAKGDPLPATAVNGLHFGGGFPLVEVCGRVPT